MTKYITIIRFLALPLLFSQYVNAQIGYGSTAPNKASLVDMQSNTKGLMIPRVALQGVNTFGPITGDAGYNTINANSLLVYNTTTTVAEIPPGYYYWSQTNATDGKWNALAVASSAVTNLAGDVTGAPASNTLSKLQGKTINLSSPANNTAITYQNSTDTWKPLAYTPPAIPGQNITAAGSATPANNPTQNIAFSPAANATGATVKAIGLQVKDGVVTLDKLGSGTATAGQGLISKGNSDAGMGTVGIKSLAATLSSSGGIVYPPSSNGTSSADTNDKITLGPGKWIIFVGSTAAFCCDAKPNSIGTFIKIIITDTAGSTTTTADRIPEYSGPSAGGGLYSANSTRTFLNGAFAVENKTAANKTYYVTVQREDFNAPNSASINVFGSGIWERHLFAMRIN